jgi:hypothetical protein
MKTTNLVWLIIVVAAAVLSAFLLGLNIRDRGRALTGQGPEFWLNMEHVGVTKSKHCFPNNIIFEVQLTSEKGWQSLWVAINLIDKGGSVIYHHPEKVDMLQCKQRLVNSTFRVPPEIIKKTTHADIVALCTEGWSSEGNSLEGSSTSWWPFDETVTDIPLLQIENLNSWPHSNPDKTK